MIEYFTIHFDTIQDLYFNSIFKFGILFVFSFLLTFCFMEFYSTGSFSRLCISPRRIPIREAIELKLFFVFTVVILAELVYCSLQLTTSHSVMGSTVILILYLIVSLFLADVISAIVHFTGDYLELTNFVNHHLHPHEILHHSYHFLTYDSYYVAFIATPLCLYFGMNRMIVLMITLIAVNTNVFHAYAHNDKLKNPKIVNFFQYCGIILSKKTHAQHHIPPYYDRNLTMINGWAAFLFNPITTRLIRMKKNKNSAIIEKQQLKTINY